MTEQPTDSSVVLPPSAAHASQATMVEQSRAVAEVQAAVVAARALPRDTVRAMTDMREACGQLALARKAFFRYPRGGQQITGPSIHLAVELARIWGNVQYGINELSRQDGAGGQSEMLAWAWDIQTNTRPSTTFIVKHAMDTQRGRKDLVDLRDIYENNANNGSRRVREMIFRVLPTWFIDEAKDRCADTLRTDGGSGKPLAARIADVIDAFSALGVSEGMLVDKVGRGTKDWADLDVAALVVVGQSLRRGETSIADEFRTGPTGQGATRATAATLAAQGVVADPAPPAPEPDAGSPSDPDPAQPTEEGPGVTEPLPPDGTDGTDGTPDPEPAREPAGNEDPPAESAPDPKVMGTADPIPESHGKQMVGRQRLAKLSILAKELGLDSKGEGREEYLALMSDIACRPITSATELTTVEAGWVIEKWQRQVDNAPKPPDGEPAPTAEPPAPVAPLDWEDTDEARTAWDRLLGGAKHRGISTAAIEATLAKWRDDTFPPGHVLSAGDIGAFTTKVALGTIRPLTIEEPS